MYRTGSGGTPSRDKMEYFENGTIKWVKSKELNGTFILDTEEKITQDALDNSAAKIFPKYAVLIAMYGATVGEYAILGEEATCNQAVCAIIPNEQYPYTFLFSLAKYSKETLINQSVGSAQQNINQIFIKDLQIPSPNTKILEFHSQTESMFQKILSNIHQIRTLMSVRDTLLPKLMSGEVRLAADK